MVTKEDVYDFIKGTIENPELQLNDAVGISALGDSLELVCLVQELEEHFGLQEIPGKVLGSFSTVADVAQWVVEHATSPQSQLPAQNVR